MKRKHCSALVGFLILSLLVQSQMTAGRDPRRDPATGRIRILYIGDPVPGSPHPIFLRDPLTDVVPVIASGFNFPTPVIRRYMRLYMPRTYDSLTTKFDVIIISDAGVRFFTDLHLNWFRDSVIDHGLALIMIGGFEAFGGNIGLGSWDPTPIQDVLPVWSLPNEWEDFDGVLEIADWENPLIASLPFREIGAYGIFYGCNIVAVKQASSTLARYRVLRGGKKHPLLCYWEVGEGSSYAMMADWTPAGGRDFLRWEHYGNYCLNVMAYVTGGSLPDDPILVYEVRQLMADFRNIRQTLEGLIEFASKFGANMAPAERMIGEAEDARSVGERSYVEAEIGKSIDEMKIAIELLEAASDRAYELKDEALVWVYVTEWLVVASTGMICGFILWTLMVRRRMYREVKETRLTRLE